MLTGTHELQFGVGRRRTHIDVLGIAEVREQRRQPTRLLDRRDHVQVGVVARTELDGTAMLAHAQTAQQPQGDAFGARRVDQLASFV